MSSSTSSPSSSPIVPQRQSVKDLLAQLSESDSDINPLVQSKTRKAPSIRAEREDDGSEDDILAGGGRLARRLAGEATDIVASKAVERPAQSSKGAAMVSASEDEISRPPAPGGQDDEDAAVFRPKRKLLLKKRKQQAEEPSQASAVRSRPLSPAGSPFSNRSNRSPTNDVHSSPAATARHNEAAESTSKSRFGALVEKARKQRLAREEAARVKEEARQAQETTASPQTRRQRGSSPADDSEEDSDRSQVAAAKRLTKGARPTRKASKKALEEINQETQRMNRNMQLAHQARTKKKFTKESFFASFNHLLPPAAEATDHQQHASSSSAPLSEVENLGPNSTPPSSPLPIPDQGKHAITRNGVDAPIAVNVAAEEYLDALPSFKDILAERRAGQRKATLARVSQRVQKLVVPTPTLIRTALDANTRTQNDLSSDSDLDIIADKASKRKYSAFENLPKKKSKEKPSHLALRSLANIKHERDPKSTIPKADMGPALLRAARKQAQEERHAKIEKLKAAGVTIVTAEEREKEEEELEDLVEKARQEDEEIRKREKEMAKRDGTFQRDILDEDDSDEDDEDFHEDNADDEEASSDAEEEQHEAEEDESEDEQEFNGKASNDLIDEAVEESADDAASEEDIVAEAGSEHEEAVAAKTPMPTRTQRRKRVIDDDEDENDVPNEVVESPALPLTRKTPQSVVRSARKVIPGLQHSDDLPIGLTQAFAATMADSQTQGDGATQEQDSMDILGDLPSPDINMLPGLKRLDSIDIISESVPGSQTQPHGLSFGFSQSQRVPESPSVNAQYAAAQAPFDLTQDAGYKFSPFSGNRFAETPRRKPYSTEETVLLDQAEDSPIMQRKGRLQRGRMASEEAEVATPAAIKSAFRAMSKAAKRKAVDDFNRKKSEARQAVDEAAEESDDEYAGLGGASDEGSDEEANEEDRNMIDEDTHVGKGDEVKHAKLHANRERELDEAAVSKLLKDIATGALRRKRGAGDDLDLSDEEDAADRIRKAKQREFEKMRRALLKDEAIGKIAEDKKKEAFLKSIEDRDDADDSDNNFDQPENGLDVDSQPQSQQKVPAGAETAGDSQVTSQPPPGVLQPTKDSQLNKFNFSSRRLKAVSGRKPATLAEIRESVSFLIEEPDSQAGVLDLGLSDSEDEPEAYVNLDRHLQQAEADENAEDDDAEDLGDFVVDDQFKDSQPQDSIFKKPDLPSSRESDRAPFSERRTKAVNVVDRLSLQRQASSSTAGSNATSKMAFFTSRAGSGGLNSGPSLLRRATTNSSLGSMSGRENVSATGVVTSKTERGSAKQEKEFVRKGNTTSRNAVNYQGRQNLKEEKMSARAGVVKKQQKKKGGNGILSGLFMGDTWG